MTVIDVSEVDFEAEVIERSRSTPVIVDFWASWCGPCRALSPLLEDAAGAREGDVVLAKVDTDANPRLAQAFGIQGIPAVKAFRDGAVVDEFVGAQPRPAVRGAVELEPSRADAAIPLARLLIGRGELEEADALLAALADNFQGEGLRARIRLTQQGTLADALA